MKNSIVSIFVLVILSLTSCKPTIKTESRSKSEILNDILKKHEEPSQFFKIASDSLIKVVGEKGTVLIINPTDLITENGEEIKGNIDIELKELTDQYQMFRTNTQTVSNGKLLVSGGSYFINMKSNGKSVRLKEGKTLKVEFPKLTENQMSLFYGQRDSLGQMNWNPSPKKFEKKPKIDSIKCSSCGNINCRGSRIATPEEIEIADRLYAEIELSQLGWINCDYFLDNTTNTNLTISFPSSDKIEVANLYLIFTDINSVIKNNYLDLGKAYNNVFHDIPLGAQVRLIAYTIKEKKTFSYSSSFTIKANENKTLVLKETSESEFRLLVSIK